MLCFLLFFYFFFFFHSLMCFSFPISSVLAWTRSLVWWNEMINFLFFLSSFIWIDGIFVVPWYSDFMSQTLSEMMINWMKVESSSCPSFCSQISEMRNHLLEDKEVDLCVWKSLSKLVVNLDWDFVVSGWIGILVALEWVCEANFFILV